MPVDRVDKTLQHLLLLVDVEGDGRDESPDGQPVALCPGEGQALVVQRVVDQVLARGPFPSSLPRVFTSEIRQ